jgi:hypothetical protein
MLPRLLPVKREVLFSLVVAKLTVSLQLLLLLTPGLGRPWPVARAAGVENARPESMICYQPQPKPPPGSAWVVGSHHACNAYEARKEAIRCPQPRVCTRVSSH